MGVVGTLGTDALLRIVVEKTLASAFISATPAVILSQLQ